MKRALVLLLLVSIAGTAFAQDAKVDVAPQPKPEEQPKKPEPKKEDPKKQEPASDQDGEVLAQKVLAAAEAQDFREEPSAKVISAVVKQAAPAELANGDADISTTGPCAADIDALCLNVPPGEGRLASCILQHKKNEAKANNVGRKISSPCKKALGAYYQDRATNINKNLQFAGACKGDAKKLCSDVKQDTPGAVLACLRKQKAKLSVTCAEQVLKAQIAAANDFRVDPDLAKACSASAASLCAKVEVGEGRQQACLRQHLLEVSWDCQEQLFRQEVENSDDIRLNRPLFNDCRGDQHKFCPDVMLGSNRVKDCLEDHREDKAFSSECKASLEALLARRASDFRLDAKLRESCKQDIQRVCGYQVLSKDTVETDDAKVVVCLQDFREDLQVKECREAVHKGMERASQDIRFDEPLADSCSKDRDQFCSGIAPGSARVIRCLQDNRQNLSHECRASLFDHEVRLAEDIDFQFPLKRACATELTTLCKKVQKGHARTIRCLHKNAENSDMGTECRQEVRRSMGRMGQDYRLNYRLNKACQSDVASLCKDSCAPYLGQACGGTVLRCLQDHLETIQQPECQKEVFYFIKMEVSDFRNDVMLAEACRSDVDSFCGDVEAGESRVLECLREHRSALSTSCASEEMKLSQIQAKDVRLRPRIMKLCGEEMVVYCKDIKPGGGRMFNCLLENVQKPGFSSACSDELIKREDRMKTDYRLDTGVATECAADIDAKCPIEKAQAHGKSEVVKCLVRNVYVPNIVVSPSCEAQVSRAVRMAFWDYKSESSLTQACDMDVRTSCMVGSATKTRGMYTIGVIGRCLSKQLAMSRPLSPECRQLVSVAAPKDIRLYIQETLNPDGTPKSGLSQAITRVRASSSVITLNGWVAVASIAALIFLVIAGGRWGYRRYMGLERPYTQLVNKGGADLDAKAPGPSRSSG